MSSNEVDLSAIDLAGSLTLTVGWRSGPKVNLGRVEIAADIDAAFRDVIRRCQEDLASREEQTWSPDADLVAETYLSIAVSDLGNAPVLAAGFDGKALHEVLAVAQSVPVIHAGTLPPADLLWYALTIDAGDGLRTTFLRRNNPRRGLKQGRIYAGLHDALARIEEPIFGFDDLVDLIFTSTHVAVLSATAFAALFRDQEVLAAQVPTWVEHLSARVPITPDSVKILQERTLRDSRLKRRLEAILIRGHLDEVTPEQLRAAMEANDLDPDALTNESGELAFEDEDVPTILYFLNEDLFFGSISTTGFRADRKAAR